MFNTELPSQSRPIQWHYSYLSCPLAFPHLHCLSFDAQFRLPPIYSLELSGATLENVTE